MKIALDNIGKRYANNWIFRGISARFESGNVYGIVGHNGSGKSTLLQIISGFVTPTEGELIYNDGQLTVDQIYRGCSLATPYLELPLEFTVRETMELQGKFKPYRQNITLDQLLEMNGLLDHSQKTLHQLSSGMLQRLKLSLAITADTELLLLDEPCANLDSRWTEWFNEMIEGHRDDRIVIICSNNQQAELSLATEVISVE